MLKINKKKIIAMIMVVMITMIGGLTAVAADSNNTSKQTVSTAPQKPPIPQDALDKLAKDGTITTAQEKEIIKAFNAASTSYQEVLSSLVKLKEITDVQKTAIEKAITPSGTPGGQLGNAQGNPPGNPPGGAPGSQPAGSNNSTVVTGTAAYLQTGGNVVKTNMSIVAPKNNQSGVKVTKKGSFTIKTSTITTSGKTSSDDNSNFYGLNAGILAEAGSKINISNTSVVTTGNGANAIFSTGAGSYITVSNVKIKTTADSSRGLDATQTGTIVADKVDISTLGTHCAALATDRGNGTVTVNNSVLKTSGVDSPGIYSTGKITVSNSKVTAVGSEAAVIEGKNSITLTNVTISGAKKRGVMMYQSYSGDAEVGTSVFTMNGGALTAEVGPMFYITNTNAVINLKKADITAKSGTLITASAGNWGNQGSNGGTLAFNADSEKLVGNITCDNISTLAITLKNSTSLKGMINKETTGKKVTLSLDSSSTWSVTGTSYLSNFTDKDTTLSNIKDNGNTIYYDGGASSNSWLAGKTYTLKDGGKLTPAQRSK